MIFPFGTVERTFHTAERPFRSVERTFRSAERTSSQVSQTIAMGYKHVTRIYSKKQELIKKLKLDCSLEDFLQKNQQN